MSYAWADEPYSNNYWGDFNTIQECIADAKDMGRKAETAIWIGRVEETDIRRVNLAIILDDLHNAVCDEVGELAERCGYTVTDIKAYELGEKEPKHINLMTIAGGLGVTMYEMFERMEEIEEPENINLDVIRNALEAYEANIVTPLDRIIVKALKELIEYKDIGLIPQAIKDMDKMYLEKCQQVNRLTCTCEMYERMAKHG